MSKDLNDAKELLAANEYTCVLKKNDELYTSRERGVKPLLMWLDEKKDFTGFSAADKVVGKAAAFLYVLLNPACVYAKIISESALQVLTQHHIEVSYDIKVEAVRNRTNTGFCPMETAVKEIADVNDALAAIRKKYEELNRL